MSIIINLDLRLIERGMSLKELSERVGISVQNLCILKKGRARAIRFSTLEKLCEVLECTPGDILDYSIDNDPKAVSLNERKLSVRH